MMGIYDCGELGTLEHLESIFGGVGEHSDIFQPKYLILGGQLYFRAYINIHYFI
jgi:hypothetical protein